MEAPKEKTLCDAARRVRIRTLQMIHDAGGHPGGALSVCELLVYVYSILTPDDYVILSKGHAAPALYATFAEYGLLDEASLATFRQVGSKLQGHPHTCLPGIVTPTGSLGQGASVGVGIAMGLKWAKKPGRVICLLGDGELQEGIVWEAAMCAAHYRLENLLWIVDYNGMQSDALIFDTMKVQPLWDKFTAFGWDVKEVDGHDFPQMQSAFDRLGDCENKPHVILAYTTKGKGVSFMKNDPAWHGSMKITNEQMQQALKELEAK